MKKSSAKKKGRGRKAGDVEAGPGMDGGERLRKAASRVVARNCEKIAKALLERTIEGHAPSVRLLLSLVERHPEQAEPEREQEEGRSAAIDLAMTPEEKKEWGEGTVR